MPKNVYARMTFAFFLTVALIDLQLYIHRFLPPKAMLGQYLHKQIEQPRCTQLVVTETPPRCVHKTQQRDAEALPF